MEGKQGKVQEGLEERWLCGEQFQRQAKETRQEYKDFYSRSSRHTGTASPLRVSKASGSC